MANSAAENVLDSLVQEAKKLPMGEFMVLHPNPVLVVEGETLVARTKDTTGDTTLRTTAEQEIETQAFLVVERPDSSAFGLLTVGRSRQNHAIIDHRRVSKIHVVIHREGEGFHIMDMGSSNGTTLNDRPLPPRVPFKLSDQDVIVLADKVLLRFLYPASTYEWLHRRL